MAETDLNYETDLTPAITSLNVLPSDTSAGFLVACSAAIDNTGTTNQVLDCYASLTVNYPNAAPTVAYVTCYYAHWDGSTWSDDGYGDAPDGTDQTITIGSPTCLKYAGTVPVLQNKITQSAALLSVATVFGFVPPKFAVVVHNGSGQTIGTTTNLVRITRVTAVTA